jgi:subtilisin-like proprotein convertase family protein
MKHISLRFLLLIAGCFFIITNTHAQRFWVQGRKLNDFQHQFKIDTFFIPVSGLPDSINNNFGIAKIGIDILHNRVSDLKIELMAPDGTSIWLTNRNGRDSGSHYINTSFSSNGFKGYIHQGSAPFTGEYIPDGRIEFLNNGQNPNGIWKVLVQDLKDSISGQLYYAWLQFEKNPTPTLAQGRCTMDNATGCIATKGSIDSSLLPDLIMIPSFTINQVQEYKWNDVYYPGQLRFAATMGNVGEGPLELFGKNEWFCGDTPAKDSASKCPNGSHVRQKIYQNVYYKQGDHLLKKERFAGYNYYDAKPGHNHYHVEDWVAFRLMDYTFDKKGNIIHKKQIAEGRKETYCLFDSGTCTERDSFCICNNNLYTEKNLHNYGLGTYNSCHSRFQGISVGGYDTYGMMYEGQYLQLPKNLKSGAYYLEIEIDPKHNYLEKDHSNDTYVQKVELKLQEQ